MKKLIVGIDYSITSPGLCAYSTDFSEEIPNINNCKFMALTENDKMLNGKYTKFYKNFDWLVAGPSAFSVERWQLHAQLCLQWIHKHYNEDTFDFGLICGLEGYAYCAKGLVFNIGEATQSLKELMYSSDIPFVVFQPAEIKKFFSGKGNANKELMRLSLEEKYNTNIEHFFHVPPDKSPSADLVDAFAIMSMIFYKLKNVELNNNEIIFNTKKER